MAWTDTKTAIRDVILLVLGAAGLAHEMFLSPAERPLILGAALSCLGLPLVSGIRR